MPDPRIPHAYVLVRTDIPLADQLVQCSHAVMEAAWRFPRPDSQVHLVVLAVPSQEALKATQYRAFRTGIDFEGFDEPDDDLGFTALCTKPLTGAAQRHFPALPSLEPEDLTAE